MARDEQLKKRWEELVEKLSVQFADGDLLELDAIIYLVGVQELGRADSQPEPEAMHAGLAATLGFVVAKYLTGPAFQVLVGVGVDPVHFAIIMSVNLTVGLASQVAVTHLVRPGPRSPGARSIDMIGVIPEPALMNSSFSGTSSGSTKSPSTPPSPTMVPTRPRLVR